MTSRTMQSIAKAETPRSAGGGIVIDGCAGPGGWSEALRQLGIADVGIEMDAAACATRRAAGHATIRADVSTFPVAQLAGKVWGQVHSPPCTTFSAAGKRAGTAVTDILTEGIRDAFAGRKTRALRRRQMARALRRAWWPSPKMTRAERSAKIWAAVRSASLVTEPARFIAASLPEWVALEQVPSVLPLWRVYADELRRLGYSAWCGKLNAADYGVPQTRERAILIASRVRAVRLPAHPLRPAQGHATVGHAVGLHGRGARLGRDRPPRAVCDRWRHVHGGCRAVRPGRPGRARGGA